MADQLSGDMGNLALGSAPQGSQQGGHQTRTSYIPPHMRGKMGAANGPPPMNGPGGPGGPGGPPPGPGPMNGLNSSAWAG